MSLDQLLACSQCPAPQTFNPSQPLWMCACGHLRCSAHQTSSCCDMSPAILGDALADPLVKETCAYLLFLRGLGQEYVDFVYEKLAGLIIGRVEELYANYRLCSICRRVMDAVTGLCSYCREQEEEEKRLSVSAPVPRHSSNLFLSLETLSMNPAQRLEPWQCPKCGAIVPAAKMTCACKYVDWKRVEIVLNSEESLKPKVVQTIAPQVSGPQCWTCTHCRYEYNTTEECFKCHQSRRAAVSLAGWTCVHCQTSNSQSLHYCSRCNRANLFASLASWTCPACNRKIQTAECEKCHLKREDLWTCNHCHTSNSPKRSKCRSCSKEREWACSACTYLNPKSKSKCIACETPRK